MKFNKIKYNTEYVLWVQPSYLEHNYYALKTIFKCISYVDEKIYIQGDINEDLFMDKLNTVELKGSISIHKYIAYSIGDTYNV